MSSTSAPAAFAERSIWTVFGGPNQSPLAWAMISVRSDRYGLIGQAPDARSSNGGAGQSKNDRHGCQCTSGPTQAPRAARAHVHHPDRSAMRRLWVARPMGPIRSDNCAAASPMPVSSTRITLSTQTHSPSGMRWRFTVRSAFR